eukprot:11982896-Alexandrium_andersonii.AAC.1
MSSGAVAPPVSHSHCASCPESGARRRIGMAHPPARVNGSKQCACRDPCRCDQRSDFPIVCSSA